MAHFKHDFSLLSVKKSLGLIPNSNIDTGLTSQQAQELLSEHGLNQVKLKNPWHWLKTLLEPFASWFVLILLIAAVISFWIGKSLEGIVVMMILLINASIYYIQNYSTNRILKALEKQQQPYTEVVRDGREVNLPVDQLVLGDIVNVHEGMKIPADGRLIEAEDLTTDESMLTGESEKQAKNIRPLKTSSPIYNQTNMVFMGTTVSAGIGRFIVVATGGDTEFGRIARLSKKTKSKSPLQQKIDRLTKQLIVFVGLVAIGTLILKLYRGSDFLESLRFVLSLSVSAIPEGLPIAVVIVMVVGVKAMARQRAVVRNLNAIETLGQVTMIATDKTGTITENQLKLTDTWVPGKNTNFGLVASRAVLTRQKDEIDLAIAEKYKPEGSPVKIIPFQQDLRLSGAVWKKDKQYITYIKGAPEIIISACKLARVQASTLHKQIHKFSSQGLRVIAVAAKLGNTKLTKNNLTGFSFAGLLVLGDTIRPDVRSAVEQAHLAGIDVILLTGDHVQTAAYFAKEATITNDQHAIDGSELASLDHSEIRHVLDKEKAVGRVLPEYKYLILEALQRTHITAMTGDGINDVPALRRANVGIAVGTATDAAKEASDMIITDSNFATIVRAINYGRAIVVNVQKMLTYVLATNLGEIFTIVGALILNIPLPITALQILWINVVTDSFTMIPIGMEKPEGDLIKQAPRHPNSPIIENSRKLRMVAMAVVMSALTLGVYYWGLLVDQSSAGSLAFMMLVAAQWANAINVRSDNRSFIKSLYRPNWWLVGGISIGLLLQYIVMFTPVAKYLNTQALSLEQLLVVLTGFIVILIAGDILKKIIKIK